MTDAAPSRWDDFLDIFIAPGRVFARRTDGAFGLPMLVLTLGTALLFFATRSAMGPVWDAEFQRGMAAAASGGQALTPEQLEAGRKFAGIMVGIFSIVGAPIAVLLLGLVIQLGGKVAGASFGYPQGATIAAFAWFPRLVEGVVNAFQALLMDEGALTSRYSVSLGVGRFLDPDTTSPVLLGLLGRVDLFTLWVTVLIGLGIMVMGKRSAGQAAAGAAFVWVVGAIPSLLQGLQR